MLSADSVIVGQSGAIDANTWILNVPGLLNSGLIEVRGGLTSGGSYVGASTSELRVNDGQVVFRDSWEVAPKPPSLPPGGSLVTYGRITGPGVIELDNRAALQVYGVLRPMGTLELRGGSSMEPGSVLELGDGRPEDSGDFDALVAYGGLTLNGAGLTVLPSFPRQSPTSYRVLDAFPLTGRFSTLVGLVNGSLDLHAQYDSLGYSLFCCTAPFSTGARSRSPGPGAIRRQGSDSLPPRPDAA